MEYKVILTTEENAALSYVAVSQQEWIENAVKERCRIAIDEIASFAVQKCFESDVQVPGSKEQLVTLAFEQGWVKTAEQRTIESEQNKAQ